MPWAAAGSGSAVAAPVVAVLGSAGSDLPFCEGPTAEAGVPTFLHGGGEGARRPWPAGFGGPDDDSVLWRVRHERL